MSANIRPILTYLGELGPSQPVLIDFRLPSDFDLLDVVVWNYNRPNYETQGARQVCAFLSSSFYYIDFFFHFHCCYLIVD